MEKENATHRIDIEVRFDPSLISKEEIKGIIFRRRENLRRSEIIEYEFEDVNLIKASVYISKDFISKSWDAELVKFYAEEYLGDLMFPAGIEKSEIAVEVEKLK